MVTETSTAGGPRFVNIVQALAEFQVSKRTLYYWLADGRLRYERRGPSRLVAYDDLKHLPRRQG